MPTRSERRRGSGGTSSTHRPRNGAQTNAQPAAATAGDDGWSVEPTLPPLTRARVGDADVSAVVEECLTDGQPRSRKVADQREATNLAKRLRRAAAARGAVATVRIVERDGLVVVVAVTPKPEEAEQ